MKYAIVVVDDGDHRVVAEVDDMLIARMIADNYEKSPVYDEIYIAKVVE